MSLHPARIILAVALLAACAVESGAQQTPKAPADQAVPVKAPEKTTSQAAPQQSAPVGGLVVFIDPATGKIRQPDAAEIGALTGSPAPASVSGAASVTGSTMTHGPGNTILVKLGDDSLSYMVVTKTPDGKLAEECVTGDKAAAALVSKGVTPKTTAAPKKAKEVLDDK